MHRLLSLAALCAAAILVPRSVHAVCVGPTTPCREYERVPFIFQGVVEQVTPTDYDDREIGRVVPSRLAHVRVERGWKGVKDGASIDLISLGRPGGGLWVEDQFDFKPGEKYLIWAYPSQRPGTLHASACGRTRTLDQAGEDLEFLESLSRPPGGGFIYGRVWQSERTLEASGRPARPLAGAVVTLIGGAGDRREARTDTDGRYRFGGLKTGSYDVAVVLEAQLAGVRPDYADAHVPQQEMPVRSAVAIEGPRDCAQADFRVQTNGAIAGFAAAEGGAPVAGVVVRAALVDEVRKVDAARQAGKFAFLFSAKAVSRADGGFEFTNLPPGRYVVAVNPEHVASKDEPYPRTFYPGVSNLDEATVLELQSGQQLPIGALRLPVALQPVTVKGVVLRGDGGPAPELPVLVSNQFKARVPAGRTDKEGRFELTLYPGYSYDLRAVLRDAKGMTIAIASRRIDSVESVIEPLKLVLRPTEVR